MKIWQLGFERTPPLFCPFGTERLHWECGLFFKVTAEWGMGLRQVKMPESQPLAARGTNHVHF